MRDRVLSNAEESSGVCLVGPWYFRKSLVRQHPYFISIYFPMFTLWKLDNSHHPIFVMVLFRSYRLYNCFDFRQYLDEEFVLRVMTQLTLALKECHRRSDGGHTVLHRDLKPANVFLDGKQNVKLGDFGLARILNHDTSFAKTFVGTPYYMSPVSISEFRCFLNILMLNTQLFVCLVISNSQELTILFYFKFIFFQMDHQTIKFLY